MLDWHCIQHRHRCCVTHRWRGSFVLHHWSGCRNPWLRKYSVTDRWHWSDVLHQCSWCGKEYRRWRGVSYRWRCSDVLHHWSWCGNHCRPWCSVAQCWRWRKVLHHWSCCGLHRWCWRSVVHSWRWNDVVSTGADTAYSASAGAAELVRQTLWGLARRIFPASAGKMYSTTGAGEAKPQQGKAQQPLPPGPRCSLVQVDVPEMHYLKAC